MSTSQTHFLSEIQAAEPLSEGTLAYLQQRTKNRFYNFILKKFLERELEGLTRAELARRIGRRPEVITRLLGSPSNWTIDTLSDLLVGIAREEFDPASSSLLGRHQRNYRGDEWLTQASGPRKPETATDTGSFRFYRDSETPQ